MRDDKRPDTILIADDTEVNRSVLRDLFHQEYEVDEAENGREAIRIIAEKQGRLAAVLLDFIMPEVDGKNVLRSIRRKNLIDIPVFLIIAGSIEESAFEGYEEIVADTIQKPIVEPGIVRKRVNNGIELYQLRREIRNAAEEQTGCLIAAEKRMQNTEEGLCQRNFSDRTFRLLEQERQRYSILSKMSGEILFSYDAASDTLEFTEKYQEVFGVETKIRSASSYLESCGHLSPEDCRELFRGIRQLTPDSPTLQMDLRLRKSDGKLVWFEAFLQAQWDFRHGNQFSGCFGKLTSIHQRKQESLHWKEQAMHDYLTRLCNRQGFETAVNMALEAPQAAFSIMILDVDNLKKVNDTKGHLAGDELLKSAGDTVKSLLRSTDVVARIGGDEFAVLLHGLENREVLRKKAENICRAFREKLDSQHHCGISASIGISTYPRDGQSYEELLRKADMALYEVKEHGKDGFAFYTVRMEQSPYLTALSDIDP
mgnify:FL=1